MTWILCDVTECRYNDHEQCALSEITVGPGSVGVVPEILEPTAHLSPESLLAGYPGALIIVSHDRELLDNVSTHTLWWRDGTFHFAPGTYSAVQHRPNA